MKARIRGVSTHMRNFYFFLGTMLGHLILSHSDNLSRTLQSTDITASEGQNVMKTTVKVLESLRTEANFTLFWSNVNLKRKDLDVMEPSLPRKRKRPARYEVGNAEAEFRETVEDQYRQIYYQAIDTIVGTIRDRFDQDGYKTYLNLENLLLKATRNESFEQEFDFVTNFYGGDLNTASLQTQLEMLKVNLPAGVSGVRDIIKYIRNLTQVQRDLLSDVCTVIKLILVMPATNAVSERSFSALRRVKTYLRATMTQERLNHVMVLHVHKNLTDKLNLNDIGNDLVGQSEHRLALFGSFSEKDRSIMYL